MLIKQYIIKDCNAKRSNKHSTHEDIIKTKHYEYHIHNEDINIINNHKQKKIQHIQQIGT